MHIFFKAAQISVYSDGRRSHLDIFVVVKTIVYVIAKSLRDKTQTKHCLMTLHLIDLATCPPFGLSAS